LASKILVTGQLSGHCWPCYLSVRSRCSLLASFTTCSSSSLSSLSSSI